MSRINDLTGNIYSRLTVLSKTGLAKDGHVKWRCKCDCGQEADVIGRDLKNGNTKSCGCFKRESLKDSPRGIKHGMSHSKLHRIWSGMKGRCANSLYHNYKYYGAKGISVCDDWILFNGFMTWAIETGYIEGLTIDRINPNGNYEPNNCEWVSMSENSKRMWRDKKNEPRT